MKKIISCRQGKSFANYARMLQQLISGQTVMIATLNKPKNISEAFEKMFDVKVSTEELSINIYKLKLEQNENSCNSN